jgi:hypothetical protein
MNAIKAKLIGKLFLFWLLAVALLVMGVSLAEGESLALLLVDLKNGFADNPVLWGRLYNKLVCLTLAFLLLLLCTLVTKDFLWKIQVGKLQFDVTPANRGNQILCNVVLGVLALAVVLMFTKLRGGANYLTIFLPELMAGRSPR